MSRGRSWYKVWKEWPDCPYRIVMSSRKWVYFEVLEGPRCMAPYMHGMRKTFHPLCIQVATKRLARLTKFSLSRARSDRRASCPPADGMSHYGEIRRGRFLPKRWWQYYTAKAPEWHRLVSIHEPQSTVRGPRELNRGSTDNFGHIGL